MKIDWTKVKEGFTTMDVLKEENKELREENNRLNNILNELEKEFDKELENLVYREEKLYTQGIHDTIINHKHLLQELKGSE